MNINNYELITHKLIDRPYGWECRYTVRKETGTLIDDVVSITDEKINEEELARIIENRLKLLDVEPEVI